MSNAAPYFLRRGSPIIALATAQGGPVAILRISGRDLSIYNRLFSKPPVPGSVTYTKVADIDKAVVLSFKAPYSFTGEDVLEIQCHGVKALLDSLVRLFEENGVQQALPGEFSFRAVMNQKMTLEQAEALNMALSDSSLSLGWARKLVGLSKLGEDASKERIEWALKKISVARGRVEAAIDYPEAEAEQETEVQAAKTLVEEALRSVELLLTSFENFTKHKSGLRLLILGSPNVGKSTLLNLLAGGERALVSDEAGTTRDFIDAQWRLRSGIRVTTIDTAGIRFGNDVGKVEEAGIRRALMLAEEVDAVLLVKRVGEQTPSIDPALLKTPHLVIQSHADLMGSPKNRDPNQFDFLNEPQKVLEYVESWVSSLVAQPSLSRDQAEYWISTRQSVVMESAAKALREALLALNEQIPIELCGQSLLEAESHLRASIGEKVSDQYIGEIFSQFCLGK